MRQHHADEKCQADMQKKRHQNRDGADRNAVGRKVRETLAKLHHPDAEDHA